MSAPLRLAAAAAAVAAGTSAPPALALAPDTADPRAVMEAVDAQPAGDRAKGRLHMTIVDKGGSKRERVVQSRSMEFPGGRRQLILFESPADVRGTGLLTVDYQDGAKVDDQWLYLPALRKSTRISSSDKSGSFMGSDLSFADMTGQSPDQYDFEMVAKDATVDGEACWHIEARPRTAKAKEETGYVKSHVWVSKSKLLPLQAKHWVAEGKKIKLMKSDGYKQVGGLWVAHRIVARTMQGPETLSTTVLALSDIRYDNPDVTEADFTQRRLEQGL